MTKEIEKTGKKICKFEETGEVFRVTKWAEDEYGTFLYAIDKELIDEYQF